MKRTTQTTLSAADAGAPLWTTREAAEFLRVSPSAVVRMVKRDPSFPEPVHIGRSVRYVPALVLAWVAGQVGATITDGPTTLAARIARPVDGSARPDYLKRAV